MNLLKQSDEKNGLNGLSGTSSEKWRSRCDFSAGNTGALLAARLFIVGRIKGIDRPGLMSTMPVIGKDAGFDMLDLGANADNKPEHLANYAVLGSFMLKSSRDQSTTGRLVK